MNKYQHGEVINLRWDGWMEDYLYVRGHMTIAEANCAIEGHYDTHGTQYRWDPPIRAWARWSIEPGPDGIGQTLRDYDSPGRGRFAVMRARVIAKHKDQNAWHDQRKCTVYNRVLQRSVLRTPLDDRCPCTNWQGTSCSCNGACECHWVRNFWPVESGDPRHR